MPTQLEALRASVDRLADLVRPLGDGVTQQAYPSEWTIADVVSHLGSGAVISQRRLEAALGGPAPGDEFPEQVWEQWNAKSPHEKVDDGLAADAALTARLESVPTDEQPRVVVPMGPVSFAWDQVVGFRLNEHVVHEWDVAVALDPNAALAPDGVALVIDNLDLIGRYTAKPAGKPGRITIRTVGPDRAFAVTVAADHVEFAGGDAAVDQTLTMPAEAFIRLVYGRLDQRHTPSTVVGDASALEQLRRVFPGP